MSAEALSFQLGKFRCIAVSDGTHTYTPPAFPPPAPLLFTNASSEQLKEVLIQYNIQLEQWRQWKSPYICLVIDTGKSLVLVDTGADGLSPDTGKLIPNLESVRISPDDIDFVILTHAHPDHVGGNADSDGKTAFRNARYVFLKTEWDFWTSGQAEKTLDAHIREVLLKCARQNLPPVREQLDLVNDGEEIVNGIRAIAAPGHTPGHMVLSVHSEGQKLLCLSDTILHPIHVQYPQWFAAVDFSPEQVVATRRQLLKMAATEKALVIAFHFPFPGLGYVAMKGESWQWQPVEHSSG